MPKKISYTEFKKSIPQILELFNTSITPLEKDSKEQRIKKIKKDFWFFFRNYLPHYADAKSPKFHKEIITLLEESNSPLIIGAPRGFSKSTLVSFAYVIWCVLIEKCKFIVIISATDTLAEDLCDFIRIEFSDNIRILSDFGKLLPQQGAGGDFIAHKTRILARGRKQAIRGFRSREHRPDLIILDDIEKDEEAISPKIVAKTLNIITRGLIPSLKPGGKLIIIGTILRKRSVVGTLLLSDEEPWNMWSKKIYRAIEPTYKGKEKSLWEQRFPLRFLQKQKVIMGVSAFNAEYQNMPTDDESGLFKESYIKDGNILPDSSKILFIDPSVDGIKNNDYKACVLVGKDSEGMFEIINASLIQGADIPFFESVLSIYQEHQESILGTYIESNSFQFYYMKELDKFARNKDIDLRISGVKHYQKKELRISRLLPLFETNRIVFNPIFRKTSHGKTLVEQLIFFPNSNIHDDGPDALASAIDILSKLDHKTTATSAYQVLPKKPNKFQKRSSFYG